MLYILARWVIVYQIFRVGVLIPLYLDYGRKDLLKPQKQYHCKLVFANILFFGIASAS